MSCFWTSLVGVSQLCGGGPSPPTGPRIFVAGQSGTSAILSMGPGAEFQEIPGLSCSSASTSPDGSLLATTVSSKDKTAKTIYRTSDFSIADEFGALNAYTVSTVAFSPDGALVALTASNSSGPDYDFLRVFRVSDGASVFALTEADVLGGAVRSVAFTPDSSKMFVGRTQWPHLVVYDVATWSVQTVESWTVPYAADPIAVTGAGGSLVAASQFQSPYIGFYDTTTLLRVQYGLPGISTYTHWIRCASPDGALLGLAMPWGIQMYDIPAFTESSIALGLGAPASSAVFNADGTMLLTSSSAFPYIRLFDTATWTEIDLPSALNLSASGGACFLP